MKQLHYDQITSVAWMEHCDYAYDDHDEPFVHSQSIKIFSVKEDLPSTATIFCGTTQNIISCLLNIPKEGNYILITRDNDASITESVYRMKPPSVKHWYAINCAVNHPDITAIPYGINNLGGDSKTLINAIEENPKEDNEKIYCRININTGLMKYPHDRHKCLELMKRLPSTVIDEQIDGYENFKQIRKHRYIAAPRGTGACTLRVSESIVCGSVPIMSNDVELHNAFDDLPVIFTKDWNFDMDWLTEQYDLVKNKPTDKIRMSYWLDNLKTKKDFYGIGH